MISKQMKKLKLITITCLLMLGLSVQAEKKQTLTINGETVQKLVTRITFEGDNVVLLFSDGASQTADMESVKLSFSVEDLTAIGTIKGEIVDKLFVEGLEPGTEVVIYNTEGKQMMTARASEVQTVLKTKALKKGIYLMKAGKQVVKFVKR